jgi:virginiamycin A acetyltransferase
MSNPEGVSRVGVELGRDVYISPDARIHPSIRGSRITIGDFSQIYDFVCIRAVGGIGDITIGAHCYINPSCVMYSGNGITLGDYVLLAPGVMLLPSNHAYASRDLPIRHQGFSPSKGGIVIEDDVWLGANCVVLDGTSIGKGSIVAAGSVVRGVIPAYEVWGGVPAVKIKVRE